VNYFLRKWGSSPFPALSSSFTYNSFHFQIEECVTIDKQMRNMEEAVELNPLYVKKMNIAPEDELVQGQKLPGNFV